MPALAGPSPIAGKDRARAPQSGEFLLVWLGRKGKAELLAWLVLELWLLNQEGQPKLSGFSCRLGGGGAAGFPVSCTPAAGGGGGAQLKA